MIYYSLSFNNRRVLLTCQSSSVCTVQSRKRCNNCTFILRRTVADGYREQRLRSPFAIRFPGRRCSTNFFVTLNVVATMTQLRLPLFQKTNAIRFFHFPHRKLLCSFHSSNIYLLSLTNDVVICQIMALTVYVNDEKC